ncbi:elongation of very long chain fatty acids protein-like protein [Leptotrombidium deliense]|uniref:Elongation of very long chain fatty acids protein n=1 Tax=Leptotrombidium deliense TaxID=299467 RepID=A0A443SNP7_9ACAR|nr:elongation of very long chain fatty acids protein-like protein [Leptotrombidium deliense]
MALILEESKHYYVNLMDKGDELIKFCKVINGLNNSLISVCRFTDERVQNWPLMQGPLPTVSICLSYVIFVKVLGPQLMKNRDPLNVRWLMIFYNFVMVFVSLYIFVKLGIHGWFGKYDYSCQPVDYSNSEDAVEMASICWWYYITKFIEFADTLFFVMRKKSTHVSTLHVIHHGVMPMSVWWGVKFTPGGHSTFFAFINSLIHVLMYIYYFLASFGPQMNKYLRWKKYMTSIQMVQFVMIFVHSFQLLFRECNYPRGFMWWIGFHAVLFWFLFWDFYKNAYLKSSLKRSSNSTFFACAQTESLLNGMNGEAASIVRQRKVKNGICSEDRNDNMYSSTVKNSYSDVHNNGL